MVRGALLALVVVGGAALAEPLPALAQLRRLPAQLEVVVVDRDTDKAVEGATVIAMPMRAHGAEAHAEVTDRIGHATLGTESGPTVLRIVEGDVTVEQHVLVTREMRALTVRVRQVDPVQPPDPCPASLRAATPSEITALAAAVVAHAPQIADGQLLPRPIVLASFPGVIGVPGATVMDEREIQRTADRMHARQHYLSIDRVDLGAGCAKIEARISIAQPRVDRQDLLCCCTTVDVYRRRRDGSWGFSQNIGAICS